MPFDTGWIRTSDLRVISKLEGRLFIASFEVSNKPKSTNEHFSVPPDSNRILEGRFTIASSLNKANCVPTFQKVRNKDLSF
ncbi:hypothetical protein NBRC116583_17970 [Arenicella sp. 4NH20-0111]